ncbi:hypothetical protein KVL84_06725 [Helicobacter pylori]|uniref:hypothetical protein n=2 Tax=Helicobacter pylori TaxID=210 RepID=UPI001126C949|nr:hypothetical protein [Helicobacter pylori]TPH80181.1 hypothetical protein FIM55_02055 [Helicobacter pylori]WQS80190.1 hypothetical protein KVC71_06685 [Helicobacter pylori]WRB15974.1 hypothetical protein KVL84_06725 [Helicobacter pylori]
MRKTNETEKSSNELKENTQAMREQKERTPTPTHKTRLKTPTREPKKSVLEPELKNILTPRKSTRN